MQFLIAVRFFTLRSETHFSLCLCHQETSQGQRELSLSFFFSAQLLTRFGRFPLILFSSSHFCCSVTEKKSFSCSFSSFVWQSTVTDLCGRGMQSLGLKRESYLSFNWLMAFWVSVGWVLLLFYFFFSSITNRSGFRDEDRIIESYMTTHMFRIKFRLKKGLT